MNLALLAARAAKLSSLVLLVGTDACPTGVAQEPPVSPASPASPTPTPAADSRLPPPAPAEASQWRIGASFEAVYDSNVFRLSDSIAKRLPEDRSGDQISGRFKDMKSVDDIVLTTELSLGRELKDADGDRFRLEPGLRYVDSTSNPERSHPEFFLDLTQDFGPTRKGKLEFEYQRDTFLRNYLADAVDFVNNVTSSERRYEAGVFDEWSASATFDQRLWKRSGESWSGWQTLGLRRLDLEASLGFGRRTFDSPFANHDRDRISAGLDVAAALGSDWVVTLGYGLDLDRGDNDREVMLLDEAPFGRDFNGDTDQLDLSARAFERADRSRNQHELKASLRWDLATDWSTEVGAALVIQRYRSNEPFDLVHRGRVDRARQLDGSLDWEFASDWKLSLTGGVSKERSNRSSAPGAADEAVGYKYWFAGLGISAKF